MCPLHSTPPGCQHLPSMPAEPLPSLRGSRQRPQSSPWSPTQFAELQLSFPAVTLGGFPGLLTYRLFRLPFCWGYQFSGFLGWLCFNLSPWSRLRRLPLSLGQEEMEGPRVSRAGSGASGFPGTDAGIAGRLLSPANLPPSKPAGELLNMQFPFIFPVKSLPMP